MFNLSLRFAPAFHRACSIHIVGEVGAVATFEAQSSGLLPRVALTIEADAFRSAELRACCQAMFDTWDDRWSKSGLDGISVDGTFEESNAEHRLFRLWSPPKNSGAHAMLAAALVS